MSDALTGAELEGVLEKYVRNKMAMEALAEENETIKGYFKQDNPEFGKKVFGRFYIQTSRNARVDDKLAREQLTDDEYQDYSKRVIDGPVAKRFLTPAQYELIQKESAPKIEIGIV